MTWLDEVKARLGAGDKWCQLMPEGYATSESGPKLCKCGTIGFPFEHKPPPMAPLGDLDKAIRIIEVYEWALKDSAYALDRIGYGVKWSDNSGWFDEVRNNANKALAEAEAIKGGE